MFKPQLPLYTQCQKKLKDSTRDIFGIKSKTGSLLAVAAVVVVVVFVVGGVEDVYVTKLGRLRVFDDRF